MSQTQTPGFRFQTSKDGEALKVLINAMALGQASSTDGTLSQIVGTENYNGSIAAIGNGMNWNQQHAVASQVRADGDFSTRAASLKDLIKHGGMESFSMQLEQGTVARMKAATLDLNARGNKQWAAAEALYPTLVLPYTEEALVIPIDIAGVGAYNSSGNVNEAWENLRPIASVLSDSKFNPGDDLKLVPVLPENAQDANAAAFVPSTVWSPWAVSYDDGDLLGRQSHNTNFLAVKKLNNLMSLCRAPGAPAFEQNDEIEASSIKLNKLLLKITTKDGDGSFVLDTSTMSGAAARPSTGTTSEDKRQINFPLTGLNVTNLKDADGNPTALFKSLTDAGMKVFIQLELTATYQRSTRTWSPTVSPVSIDYVIDKDGNRLTPGATGFPADLAALVTAQKFEGEIEGIYLTMNHNNVNRSRYGTTVVYASNMKSYNINRRQPISIKYPMLDADNNASVLAMLVKQMDVMVQRNMSHDAFKAANAHFDYVHDNNGMKIVNINDDSASILPGQHFLGTVGLESTLNLVEEVSTLESKNTRENIEAVLVNKLWDLITALRINSNISALKEMDDRDEEYTVVAHASLAPFLMTQGDYRTFGQNIKFTIVETNIDSEVGRMWVVPKSHTKDGEVDIFGGMGINVAKELLVIEGSVQQSDRQYRMIITQPAYQHHSLCPVVGRVVVEDIADLLGEEGLITKINKLQIAGGPVTTVPQSDTSSAQEIPVAVD